MSAHRQWPWRLRLPWLALLLVSAALHLAVLGDRSFHHDEAIHASLSWDLAERGAYRYNPTYHGPLLYYLTAVTARVLPEGAIADRGLVARLPIALAGIAMLWIAWTMRRVIGGRAAWWTGLLFTTSPVFLYFGRFLRMDLLEVLCASAALVAWWEVLRGYPQAWLPLGVWAGLAVATKENAYVTMALLAVVALAMALIRGPRTSLRRALAWLSAERNGVATAVLCFLATTTVLYTVGLRYPADIDFPFRAVAYWWQQHLLQRVSGPWWYHLPRLVQYELPILVAATVWVVRRRRRLHNLELFLFLLGSSSVLMYAYLGEKVPWLLVHQVWPFIPLAGAQLARSFGPNGRWWSRTLAGAGLAVTLSSSLVCCFVLDEISPNLPRVETLHYVQTSPEIVVVAQEGRPLLADGTSGGVVVDGAAIWPLCWYWRGMPVRWTAPEPGSTPALVICDPPQAAEILDSLDGSYSRERLPLRSWWLLYRQVPTTGEVLRYLLTRRPWGYIGSSDVVVLRRIDGGTGGVKENDS